MAQFRRTGPRCVVVGKRHEVLSGTAAGGGFRTKAAEAYPKPLCRRLARAFEDERRAARAKQLTLLLNAAQPG
eukprot:4930253-Alexandrium_andersonii.AAC.1